MTYRPDGETDELGEERCAIFGRNDRMAHGEVTIETHHHQQEAAGDLVDRSDRQIHLAPHPPEEPLLVDDGDDQKEQANEKHLIGDGQVEDVHVGHGLHLRVA